MLKVIKALWIAASVIVLGVTLAYYDGRPNSDVDIFLLYAMLALAFPAGFLAAALLAAVSIIASELFGYVIPSSYTYLTVTWALFFVAGYFQWFACVPWLLTKIRARRAPGHQ